MKKFEHLCCLYGFRFKNNWEYNSISADSYINGYRQARNDCADFLKANWDSPKYRNDSMSVALSRVIFDMRLVGDEQVEYNESEEQKDFIEYLRLKEKYDV